MSPASSCSSSFLSSRKPSSSPLNLLLFLLIPLSFTFYIPFFFLSSSPPQQLTITPASPPLFPPPVPPQTLALTPKIINTSSFPSSSSPYHDYDRFLSDFDSMKTNIKIFVYPEINNSTSSFASVFLPNPNPFNPKLLNYHSEHMFKISLLHSTFLTTDPTKATFFFLPFSVNALRNDPRVRSEDRIAGFVEKYVRRLEREYRYWNESGGVDHFYVSCHSAGREASGRHAGIRDFAVQVSCSSSYFQRMFVAHKDVGLPQVWPRDHNEVPNPPHARKRLVFFSGRMQNSKVRRDLITMWGNDTSMDIFSGNLPFPYEEGFRKSKYCLHIKGYEVNTARISDAIHFGCVPVIVSNHYVLPFANVLDWSKFSIIVDHGDIGNLKRILLAVPKDLYIAMYKNLLQVRRHFRWHKAPMNYDSFLMTAYQLWLRRGAKHSP